eukprot:10255029-Ditylum_brightwellii.AAC.1
MGWWLGDTFMTYIYSQIGSLAKGVSTQMTRRIDAFYNVGVYMINKIGVPACCWCSKQALVFSHSFPLKRG